MKIAGMVLSCALLVMALAGCTSASKNSLSPTMDGNMSKCEDVYVYAPALYVINVASGQMVALDPTANDFPLFCEAEAAKAAMQKQLESGALPTDIEWKVYRVYGSWEDLAAPREDGAYLLNKPAQLIDWVE